jgi:hypothetical protein
MGMAIAGVTTLLMHTPKHSLIQRFVALRTQHYVAASDPVHVAKIISVWKNEYAASTRAFLAPSSRGSYLIKYSYLFIYY